MLNISAIRPDPFRDCNYLRIRIGFIPFGI